MPPRKARKSSRIQISLGRARQSKAAKDAADHPARPAHTHAEYGRPDDVPPKTARQSYQASSLRALLSLEHHHGPIVIERSLMDFAAGVLFELAGYTVLALHIECRTSLRNQLYVRLSGIAGNQRVVAAQRNRDRRRTSGDLPLSGECFDELFI